MTPDLSALRARVEAATGPDRMLDHLINLTIHDGSTWDTAPSYTASLDAALGLVEARFPESVVVILKNAVNAFVYSEHYLDGKASEHLPIFVLRELMRWERWRPRVSDALEEQ